MRQGVTRRWTRLGIACVIAVGAASITIADAAGSTNSTAPQRLCSGPSMVHGVPYAQCDGEFIPGHLTRLSGIRPAAARPAAACPQIWENQGGAGLKTPCEILKSYNVPGPTTASASQVIGIVDAYDNPDITTDITNFDSLYGLASLPTCGGGVTHSCFQKLNQTGATAPLPPPNSDWEVEISLDVESAHAICPNCKILLVEANDAFSNNLAAAVATAKAQGATVISNSYSIHESNMDQSYYDTYAPAYDDGVPMFASADDDGYGPAFPADVPAVISVGGTSLINDSDGGRSSESVWNGTGSGCSAFASAEPWQTMESGWGATGCGSKRSIADVSAVADPNTGLIIDTEAGWQQVGGTSLSSPLIAAMYALAANTTSAAHPAETAYWNPSHFNDITSGSNGSCGGTTACRAGAGYDGPTGIGTPNGVAGFAPEDTTPTVTSFTPSGGPVGTQVTLTGTFLSDATAVKIGTLPATFTVVSATQLHVTIPASATDGTFSVTTPDGTATSSNTFHVGSAPTNSAAPTITGMDTVGDVLTAHAGTWSGSPTSYSYQWQRCNSGGSSCTSLGSVVTTSSATTTRTLVEADDGQTLRVQVIATNDIGDGTAVVSAATPVVTVSAPVNTGAPTITGTATVGQTLTGNAGTWSDLPTSYTYTWLRCDSGGANCSTITTVANSSATSTTYQLVPADDKHTIEVSVIAANTSGPSTTETSDPTDVVNGEPVLNGNPGFAGAATVGKTLIAHPGSWTLSPTSYTYQWLRCDSSGNNCTAIGSGTTTSANWTGYTIAAADDRHTIKVAVTATNTAGSSIVATSAASPMVNGEPTDITAPTITGSDTVGETITASAGTWTGWATSYTYVWKRCDSSGNNCTTIATVSNTASTSVSYTVASGDSGHTIRVTVTASNNAGASDPQTSDATDVVS